MQTHVLIIKTMLIENTSKSIKYEDYIPLVGQKSIHELLLKVEKIGKRSIFHINVMPQGGGVAEILKSAVPFERSLGLNVRWFSPLPDSAFFEMTKKMHDALHGETLSFTKQEQEVYRDYNNRVAKELADLAPDILIIHDLEPLAALYFMTANIPGFSIARIHRDITASSREVAEFLMPYFGNFRRIIFSTEECILKGLDLSKVRVSPPAIDPLSLKNRLQKKETKKKVLSLIGIDNERPYMLQTGRFDSWKDPQGAVDVYRKVKEKVSGLQLVLAGIRESADDSEVVRVYDAVEEKVRGDRDVLLLFNVTQLKGIPLDQAIAVLEECADAVLHKPIHEGFGLAVTEAMWKEKPVVGANVGGIRIQIDDGKNGFLVNSSDEAAKKILFLLTYIKEAEEMGKRAKETVARHYLLPRYISDELSIILEGVSK